MFAIKKCISKKSGSTGTADTATAILLQKETKCLKCLPAKSVFQKNLAVQKEMKCLPARSVLQKNLLFQKNLVVMKCLPASVFQKKSGSTTATATATSAILLYFNTLS